MHIRDQTIGFEKLESAESVHSAESTAMSSYQSWLDIDVGAQNQKGQSNLFSSGRAQREKLERARERKSYVFEMYDKDGEQGKVTTRST
jgi:hypothetical protein